jgi:hypothetical protein
MKIGEKLIFKTDLNNYCRSGKVRFINLARKDSYIKDKTI